MDQTTKQQPISPRQMYAQITLATDLPVPRSIRLRTETSTPEVYIKTWTLAEAAAWATETGAKTYRYQLDGNDWISTDRDGRWHGWRVDIGAYESIPEPPAPELDASTTAALEQIASEVTA